MYNICSVLALFFSLFFLSFYCLKKKKELNQHLPHLKVAPFQPQLNLSPNQRKKKTQVWCFRQAPRKYRAQTPPCSCWISRLPVRAKEQNNTILLAPKKERIKQGMKWLSQKECRMIENILEPILQLREKLAKYGSHTYDKTLQTLTTTKLPTGNTPWTHDQIHALVLSGRVLVCTSQVYQGTCQN